MNFPDRVNLRRKEAIERLEASNIKRTKEVSQLTGEEFIEERSSILLHIENVKQIIENTKKKIQIKY
jgi:hypothetical protein